MRGIYKSHNCNAMEKRNIIRNTLKIIIGLILVYSGYLLAVYWGIDFEEDLNNFIRYLIPFFIMITGLSLVRKGLIFHWKCYQEKHKHIIRKKM